MVKEIAGSLFLGDNQNQRTADSDSFRNTKEPAVFMKELAKNLGS
jgi:hypothetical protein